MPYPSILVIPFTLLSCCGCGNPLTTPATSTAALEEQSSTIETYHLGFTASLSQADAIELVKADRNVDKIRKFLYPRVPQSWVKMLVQLV